MRNPPSLPKPPRPSTRASGCTAFIHTVRCATATLMLLVPLVAQAGYVYVDDDAPPGGDGSQAAPFATIQDGVDVAQPGDTVVVLPGTYAPFASVRAGADGQPITVAAETRGTVLVAGSGRVLDIAHPFHVIDGLVFDGAYGTQDAVRADGADDLVLRNVEVRRSGADCIDLRTTHRVRIEDSSIHHCIAWSGGSPVDAHGVTGDSVLGLTISGTTIHTFTGDAVQLSPSRDPWTALVIERCMLRTGPLDEDAGPLPAGTVVGENALDTKVGELGDGNGDPPTVRVYDVVAMGFRDAITNQAAFNVKEEVDAVIDAVTVSDGEIAFRLRAPAQVVVQNAVIYGVDKAFRLEDGIAGTRIVHATLGLGVAEPFEDAGGAPSDLVIENLLVLAGAVPPPADAFPSNLAATEDWFVDAPGGDYHLAPDAPAVDAAAPLPAGVSVAADRDGVARPQGPASDVGAYEWSRDGGDGTGTTGGDSGTATASGGPDSGASAGDGGSTGATASGTGGDTTDGGSGGTGTGGAASGEADGCACVLAESADPAGPAGALEALVLLAATPRRRRPHGGPKPGHRSRRHGRYGG